MMRSGWFAREKKIILLSMKLYYPPGAAIRIWPKSRPSVPCKAISFRVLNTKHTLICRLSNCHLFWSWSNNESWNFLPWHFFFIDSPIRVPIPTAIAIIITTFEQQENIWEKKKCTHWKQERDAARQPKQRKFREVSKPQSAIIHMMTRFLFVWLSPAACARAHTNFLWLVSLKYARATCGRTI